MACFSRRRPEVRRDTKPAVGETVHLLGGCHHVDAVAVDVEPGTTAIDFAQAMLGSVPYWVGGLLRVRDTLVAPFGLKGSVRGDTRLVAGEAVGPLWMFDVSEALVLAGKDDKHLSYRTTFIVREARTGLEGVCTTVVRYHHPAGRLYFRTIEPFHNAIMVSLASRAASSTSRGRPL